MYMPKKECCVGKRQNALYDKHKKTLLAFKFMRKKEEIYLQFAHLSVSFAFKLILFQQTHKIHKRFYRAFRPWRKMAKF